MKNKKKLITALALICILGIAAILVPALAPLVLLIGIVGAIMFALVAVCGWVLCHCDDWEEKKRQKCLRQIKEHQERIDKICRAVPQERFV